MRPSRRQFLFATAGSTALLAAPALRASTYPQRAITFICPWPAGGTADVTMRALCGAASASLGQNIVVDNRAGASGMIGLKTMAGAKPDGYTIGQIPISVARFSQLGTVQVDPLQDLTFIARTSGQTFGIAVKADAPWKTLNDFVADAKARPDQLTYASAGIGGATHVGMEEFALVAGIKLNHIPYKGGAPALVDLLGGQVDALADSSSWAPHVKTGKVRLLATWGAQRTIEFPDVATLREQGFDVVVDAPNGVGAPKGLDPAIAEKLGAAFKTAVQSPEFIEACRRIDAPVMYQDGAAYRQYMEETYRKETTLIERLQLKELLAKG